MVSAVGSVLILRIEASVMIILVVVMSLALVSFLLVVSPLMVVLVFVELILEADVFVLLVRVLGLKEVLSVHSLAIFLDIVNLM